MADKTQTDVTQDGVVQLAIQMEEIGRDFYEALAGATRDPRVLQLCHRLAGEEENHRQAFSRLHSELAERGESVMLTDEHVATARKRLREHIVPNSDAVRQVACGGSVGDAIDLAVKMEAEAVRFYTHLAEGMQAGNCVEQIVAEERKHLRLLSALRCGI